MNHKTTASAKVALLIAILSLPVVTSPAVAGGSFSLSYSPRTASDGRWLDFGLRAYSLYKGVRTGARISQRGWDNKAGISQTGSDNLGIVSQEGRDHSASLRQNGYGNSYGLFQFGRNTEADIVQNGDRQSGAALMFGW